jgi:hypothetical protein
MTRAAAIRALAGGVAAAVAAVPGAARASVFGEFVSRSYARKRPVLRNGGMMGSAVDMSAYRELFDRHKEIHRTVTEIPGGVRTLTESDAPEIVAQLQAHVASMYRHLDDGLEVTCMSASLPTLFRSASDYRREVSLTRRGVAITETSRDPRIVSAIRAHAREVSGFVREGMQAMMGSGR